MAIAWDLGLTTGIEEIDEQHRELFRRLDALLEAIRGGRSRDEVARTIAFLLTYVIRHFAAEETLMTAKGYPALEDHRREHETFTADLQALREEHERHGASASLVIRVNTQLTTWLRSHIFRSDRELAAWLAGPR